MNDGEATAPTERGLMMVLTNPVDDERASEFNAWYERHVREVLEVPGMVRATRYEIADQQITGDHSGVDGRRFLALYEVEADDLGAVADAVLATSNDRTHSDALEMDPLPVTVFFRQLGDAVDC